MHFTSYLIPNSTKLLNDLLFMTKECIRIVKADVKFFISTKIHHYLKNLTTAQINLTQVTLQTHTC